MEKQNESAGKDGCKPVKSQFGYPTPGANKVTAKDVLRNYYFMTEEEWKSNRNEGSYDYVIIGSSFCALAFVTQALKQNPDAKILLIERGDYMHPDHFQNLPHAFAKTVEHPSETFHWSISKEMHESEYIKWQHGLYNFVGGRSSFWSGWCPEPTREEMESWPSEIKDAVEKYFPKAKKFLNVISADVIFKDLKSADPKPIFGKLQTQVQSLFQTARGGSCEAVTNVIPAPLAVEAKTDRYEYYKKYCVVGPLLHVLNKQDATAKQPQVHAFIDCLVTKINYDGERASELETSKGIFTLGKAKLILAMGTLPSTTLVLNSCPKSSFPLLRQVGERFTAHFMSCITARVPLQMLNQDNLGLGSIELGAVYVKGLHKTTHRQFHIQITAIRDDNPEENVHHRVRHLPDYFASPSFEQLQGSKDHVVFVCACLGELDHDNAHNWFRLTEKRNADVDVTCNATLQVIPNQNDEDLWNTMDQSTFQLLEQLSPGGGIEYWCTHDDGITGSWEANRTRLSSKQIRHPGLVHEASTMRIGGDADAPVGLDYCLRGTNNVYVTGASLWPTAGSWNPVGTIVSMAMHLADHVCKPSRL